MHVLFVTDSRFDKLPSGDGSTRYRCFNVAEALIASGHRATVASLSEVIPKHISRYHVISVLRPRADARLRKLVQAARHHSIRLVADFDDLIFDISAAAESPLVLNNFADEKTVARGFQRSATACQWFDEITVSTEPLALAAERCFPGTPVYVLANGLSPLWLQHADDLLRSGDAESCAKNEPSISYLPGTRSHDADFRSIQAAVSAWLAVDSHRSLRIVGELSVDDNFAATEQVVREPLVPFFQLAEKITKSSVTLAPLVDNQFNRAKSHIKFLESAAFGIPVVATRNADIQQHHGIEGLFCPDSVPGWKEAIELAIRGGNDANMRDRLQRYVRNTWTSVQTSHAALCRWQQGAATPSPASQERVTSPVDDPNAFFLSLRPVPRYYTLNGWCPDKTTNLIVFESDSLADFNRLGFDQIESRVKKTGAAQDQWLVIVREAADRQLRERWAGKLHQWRSSSSHIEVIHARTPADRCSLLYQSEQVYWLTADLRQQTPSTERSCTPLETLRNRHDRWRRKARKFRESPGRFFADSRLLSVRGR